MVHFISKLLEFLSSRVSYCTIFSSIPHFPIAAPPPIQGMSGDLSASVAPRGGAVVLANMTNPHLAPPCPVGGVVGHNIDRRITATATSLLYSKSLDYRIPKLLLSHHARQL